MRTGLFVGAALFAMGCLPIAVSRAQDTGEACAAIEDGGPRLLCYDAIFRMKVETAPSEESSIGGVGKWNIRSETNRITDKTDVFVSVNSNQTIPARFGGAGSMAYLLLRCEENTTALTVWFGGQFMAASGGYDLVTYRIDDQPAVRDRWSESTNNEHMGLWSGGQSIPVIKSLFGHKNLLIQAVPFNENPLTLDFDISGVEAAVKDLRTACSW